MWMRLKPVGNKASPSLHIALQPLVGKQQTNNKQTDALLRQMLLPITVPY